MGKEQSKTQPDIDTVIDKAVKKAVKAGLKAGFAAGQTQKEQGTKDAYQATESRLYALPTLLKKLEDAKERLAELLSHGPRERSKDVARFARPGQRLTADEIIEALTADIRARIASAEYEIRLIKKALENIENDPYYVAIRGRYFENLSDDEIAEQIPCDASTVRRQRGRLVRVLVVWFYGIQED